MYEYEGLHNVLYTMLYGAAAMAAIMAGLYLLLRRHNPSRPRFPLQSYCADGPQPFCLHQLQAMYGGRSLARYGWLMIVCCVTLST